MLFGLGDFHEIKPGAVDCIVPTLRKECEEWGTHFVFCAGSLKAGPPARHHNLQVRSLRTQDSEGQPEFHRNLSVRRTQPH